MIPRTKAGADLLDLLVMPFKRGTRAGDAVIEDVVPVVRAIEDEMLDKVAEAVRGVSHDHDRFASCGGYGCMGERVADYLAVLAAIQRIREGASDGR